MAIDKETRILKSNTIEQLRQKSNEVSLNLGDTDQLDTLIGDKVYDYSNVAVGTNVLHGADDNSLVQKFNVKPDETLDNTGGYIILKGSPSIPSGFTADATVTQSGGFSATIVVANSEKILVKNTSGTFNAAQNLTVGSDNIANSAVLRLISESYSVGNIRVFKNGTELTQDLSANGFHVPPLSGVITLTGSPALAGYEEGTAIAQSGGFSGTVLKATSTALFLKNQSGTYNAGQNITGGDAPIAAAKHTGIVSKDIAFGNAIELNSKTTANTDDIQVKATSLVDALNEVQQDVGNIASLGTTDKTDIVSAINELETAAKGTQANYSVTAGSDFKSAINTLDAEIGTVADLNNAAGYTQQVLVPAITEIQGKIGEVTASNLGTSASTLVTAIKEHEDQIGDVNINSIASGNNTITGALTQLHTEVGTLSLDTAATNLTAAINEIEGVFDASAKTITTAGNLTIDASGDIILDADDGDITLNDGGTTFGKISNSSGDLLLISEVNDKDIQLNGKDGGVDCTALRLDMSDGGTAIFNHDIKLPDSGQALFGAGSDLKIYHDGSNSYIDEAGTGSFNIRTDGLGISFVHTGGSVNMAQMTQFGVTLHHNGNSKLATVAGGVNITGELEADSLDIDGAGDISGALTIGGVLDVGQLNTKFTNRNNVKLALNELHDEVGLGGAAVAPLSNHATSGTSNITDAVIALNAEIGLTNGILNSSGNHSATTISGVLGNLSTAVTTNLNSIGTLNTFKTAIEAREIVAGTGLTGGGNLSATRTLNVVGGSGITANANDIQVDNTVLRTTGTQTISSGSVTFGSGVSVTISGSLTVGNAGGISTFGTNLISTDSSGAEQGLQIKNNAVHSGYDIDPKLIWNHAKVAAQPQRAWQLVGLAADGSTSQTSDILTFNNYGDILASLVASNSESGIVVTADTANKNLDFAVQVDDSTIEISSNSLRLKNAGIVAAKLADNAVTSAKINGLAVTTAKIAANAVTTAKILNANVTNAKLANSSLTIGNSTISLGGTDTTLTGLTDIDLTAGDKTIFDGVGANDLTIGASNTHVKIAGNFTVEGTTTTLNTATLDVEDLNITVGKNASTSADSDGAGLTFGNYTGKATLVYTHAGTKLVSNKDIQAPNFRGALIGNASTATALATSRNFSIAGDITAAAVGFTGAGNVVLNASIDANTVDVAELNVGGTPGDGKAITYQSGGLQWATLSTTDTNTKYGISAVDGDNADEEKIRITSTGSDAGETDDVVLEAGTGLTIARSGDKITYTNSAPDQTVALTGGTNVTVSGTYPNFTIASTDTNTQLTDAQVRSKFTAGEGIDISGAGEISGEDATDSNKGIAKFNTADFAVSSGDVTIKSGGVSNAQLAGSISQGKLAGNIANGKLANSSITINGTAVSLGGSITTPNDNTVDMGDGFVIEDGDGTEVTITENKEVKFVEADAININWTDTSTGSDGDPYDLSFGIKNDGITNAMMANNAIDTAQLAADAVDGTKIADDAINSEHLVNGSVDNIHLANSSVSFGGVSVALGSSNATPAFDLTDATNVPADDLIGTINTARLPANNVTNATVSSSTLTLTRQGASNTTFGPFDNYGSWNIGDGSSSSAVTSGNTVNLNGTSGQISTTRSGDNITFALDHNYVGGIQHKNSGGASQGTGDIGSKGGRLVFKEGTNMSFSLSGTELTINGPAVNNASSLTTGTLGAARLPSTIDTTLQIGNSNDTSIQFDQDTKMDFDIDNTLMARLSNESGKVGDLMVRGDVVAVSSVITSDRKLKEDIHKVEGALELVSQLDGVTFKWKEDGRQSAGVIAQNVEEVLPSAVSEVDNLDDTDTHKVVDYNQLSALFIEAIKELKEQNKELKDEIEVLKNINSNS